MICKIADFVIDFENASKQLQYFLKPYEFSATPQFSINVTPEEIEYARHIPSVTTSVLQAEFTIFHKKLLELINPNDAFFLHAALIEVNRIGIAFTAHSGTGKTTHTLLWKKLLGNQMKIINGDKPIIRFNGNTPYGYGTPWCGKERYNINTSVPIKHICFIERSEQNSCQKISSKDALKYVFSQIYIPKETNSALKTLELLDKLLKSVTVWVIKCNTDISAAQTAYAAIFKGETQ